MKTAFTNSIIKIDFIGDIHGHADELEALLIKLGYKKSDGVYAHPERKVLFVGDYIDRGPKIKETLNIVKSMVENDNAIALMGNHEYNALCFHFKATEGGHQESIPLRISFSITIPSNNFIRDKKNMRRIWIGSKHCLFILRLTLLRLFTLVGIIKTLLI